MCYVKIKTIERAEKMIQSKLSKILKISPSVIGMYEHGRREPDIPTLKKMAAFFNVSIDYLLENDMAPTLNDMNQFLLKEKIIFDNVVIQLNDTDRAVLHQALEIAFKAIKH